MPSAKFTKASLHSYDFSKTITGGPAKTFNFIAKPTSIPTAGAIHCLGGFRSSVAARDWNVGISGNSPGTAGGMYMKVGATIMYPSTAIVPTVNKWYWFGYYKQSGTTSPNFGMLDLETMAFTNFSSTGTTVDATFVAGTTKSIGRDQTGNYWDGNIAHVSITWGSNRIDDYIGLIQYPTAGFMSQLHPIRGSSYHSIMTVNTIDTEQFEVDFSQLGYNMLVRGGYNIVDRRSQAFDDFTAGTHPAFDNGAESSPPGWR